MAIVKMKAELPTAPDVIASSGNGIQRNNTWLKLYRSTLDSKIWNGHFNKAQAWIDLLMLAAYTEHETEVRGIEVVMKKGDVVGAHNFLAKRWKWNPKTVKKYLDWLVSKSMIIYRSTNVTTIISISNWELYQQPNEQLESKLESKLETHKKGKKGKGRKKGKTEEEEKDIVMPPQPDSTDNTRVDLLDLDREFSKCYQTTTGNPLDAVVMAVRRYDIWTDLLERYTLDVILQALPAFFSTDHSWFSGRSGEVKLPFTPALLKEWLRQKRHLHQENKPVKVIDEKEQEAALEKVRAIRARMGLPQFIGGNNGNS